MYYTGQAKITATNTAVQVAPVVQVILQSGMLIRSKASNNAAGILIGSNDVSETYDGTGNGFWIAPGDICSIPAGVLGNAIYFQGTTGDVVSFGGN